MRIIVTGDRHWYAPELAEQVLNWLLVRYGPGLVIVNGGGAESTDRSRKRASSKRPTKRGLRISVGCLGALGWSGSLLS